MTCSGIKELIAAHLEFGSRPLWLQGPCALRHAALPSSGPMTHVAVSPHIDRIIHAIWVLRLH